MAPKMKPADLEKTVCYKVGGFLPTVGANIRTSNAPKDSNGKYYAAGSDENKHFAQSFNPLSFSLSLDGVTQLLKFDSPGATENIVYLPYYDKNITSTVIPTQDASVDYFITDALSGCNFFIDKLPNGNLVCYHANALQQSPTKEEVKNNAGAFNPQAVTTMNDQHTTALTLPAYHGATPLAALRVADYYAKAQPKVAEKVSEGGKDVEFYGGTTIMGFRVYGKWQFWFQTYGQVTYRIQKLFKNDIVVKIGNAPLESLEVRCFWRE